MLDNFLTAARSLYFVLEYQFGLKQLSKSNQGKRLERSLAAADVVRRKAFDEWLAVKGKAACSHPLKQERDELVHRSGQSAIRYYVEGEMVIEAGTRVSPAYTLSGMPIGDSFRYVLRLADGSDADAVPLCEEFMRMLDEPVREAKLNN